MTYVLPNKINTEFAVIIPRKYEAGGGGWWERSIILRGKGMFMWMVQVSNYHA